MKYLDTFLAFYNLRLKLKTGSEQTALELDQRDFAKLQGFLEQHTPKVLRLKDKQAFNQFVAGEKERSDVFEIWGTFGFYEHKNGIDWGHSKDFEGLLFDYQRMDEIVEDFFQNQKISLANLSWLNDLGKFQGCFLIALNQDKTPFDGDWIDLKQHRIVESSVDLLDWHGIAIGKVAGAIHESLSHLLRGKLNIRKCVLPECGKIFAPSERGRGSVRIYCSTSCRVRAYQKRRIYG